MADVLLNGIPVNQRIVDLLEAEKRGILPPRIQADLLEARNRGQIPPPIGFPTEEQAATRGQEFDTLEAIKSAAPEIAGGTLGSLATASKRTGPGLLATGAGSALGELFTQGRRALSDEPEVFAKAPRSILESLGGVGAAFGRGVAGEGLARGGVATFNALAAGRKVPSPFALEKGADDAIKLLEETGHAGEVLPAQLLENREIGIIQNILESSLFGGSKIARKKIGTQDLLDDMADDLVTSLGSKDVDPSVLGALFETTLSQNKELARAPARALYNKIQAEIGDSAIDISSIKRFVIPKRGRIEKFKGLGKAELGDDVVAKIDNMIQGDVLFSYEEVRALRTSVRAMRDNLTVEGKKGSAKKVLGELESLATGALKKTLGAFDDANGTALLDDMIAADKIWKKTHTQFAGKLVSRVNKLAQTEPEKVANAIFQKGAFTKIKNAKEAVGQKAWPLYQKAFMKKLFVDSADDEGRILGTKLRRAMSNKSGIGDEGMVAAFGADKVNDLKRLSNLAVLAQARQSGGLGSMAIQLVQIGQLASFLAGSVTGGVVVGAPAIMARMMASKKGIKLLTEGYTIPARSPEAASFVTRFSAAFIAEGKKEIDSIGPEQQQRGLFGRIVDGGRLTGEELQ